MALNTKKISLLTFLLMLMQSLAYTLDLKLLVVDRDLELALEGVHITAGEDIDSYTDAQGTASIALPDDIERLVITATLPGYEGKRVLVRDFDKLLSIEMLLEGVLEGEELLIEAENISKTDEQIGSSLLIDSEQIKNTAEIGVFEDILSAVALLPGVSAGNGFQTSEISVRGSDPDGTTYLMDGFEVLYPFHWGASFSIFNPNIIESTKFSAGIFPAPYGEATGGLLEVNTAKPDDGFKLKFVASISTVELLAQVPLDRNNKSGILLSSRLTYFDIAIPISRSLGLIRNTISFNRIPYIYDFYLKAFYKPVNEVELYLNFFSGNDGIAVARDASPDAETKIKTKLDFSLENTDIFVNGGAKILLGEKLLFKLLGGFEYWSNKFYVDISNTGTRNYSDAFKALYPVTSDSYNIDVSLVRNINTLYRTAQLRSSLDFDISDRFQLSTGLGSTLFFSSDEDSFKGWQLTFTNTLPQYTYADTSSKSEENLALKSFAFINTKLALIAYEQQESLGKLNLELGLRVDHRYFFNSNGYGLNTYPSVSPRLALTWETPWKGSLVKSTSFSAGAGLFNKTPFESLSLGERLKIQNFGIKIPQTLTSVIGWESKFAGEFRFRLEGYYKFVFDRFYVNEDTNLDEKIFSDGIGHVLGFDLLLDHNSRYLDLMLTYTFIYARYLDPNPSGFVKKSNDTDVRGQWYYPDFQHFHSVNMVVNIKPTDFFSITTILSFITGNPTDAYGDTRIFAASITSNGSTNLIELYAREAIYSDILRNGIAVPLKLKFSFHGYFKKSKLQWELYFAVENLLNLLVNEINGSSNNNSVDIYSGKSQDTSTNGGVDFPYPSFGFKISF